MYFQNRFIAVNLMIDNRFGRAAGVGLGSLLVIPFLFLEHCFHFLLLKHFHFLVFRLVLFSYPMISFSFSIQYYLHYLIPCSGFVPYTFSFSLLFHLLLSLLDLSLSHFCVSFILCFVVVCNNSQPHFYSPVYFSRPTTSYKIAETSRTSMKTTTNQIIQAYQSFPVCTNF